MLVKAINGSVLVLKFRECERIQVGGQVELLELVAEQLAAVRHHWTRTHGNAAEEGLVFRSAQHCLVALAKLVEGLAVQLAVLHQREVVVEKVGLGQRGG